METVLVFNSKTTRSWVARNRRSFVLRSLYKASKKYLAWYDNTNFWDLERNGELFAIKTIAEYYGSSPVLILDIGANVGSWSVLAEKHFLHGEIVAFEPVPKTFHRLSENVEKLPSVNAVNKGLSSKSGSFQINVPLKDDTGSSLESVRWNTDFESVEVSIIRGDDYLVDLAWSGRIVIKIDVEGHELPALEGFKQTLESGLVDVIQFEYGRHWINGRYTLEDVYELLAANGFDIGPLMPDGVEFKAYSQSEDETYLGRNYIAVSNKSELLKSKLSA